VIDYVGGVADLRTGVLRAIGDPHRRFAEDHLRLLRAVRFAARLGFAVEEETERAIVENGPKLKGISPERIAEELRMMLTPVTRGAAWRMLWQFGLVLVVFRFFQTEGWRFVPGRWIFLRVAPEREISFALALAAGVLEYQMTDGELTEQRVLALTGRQEISRAGRAMREGLRISNEELDAMVSILQPLPVLLGSAEPGVAALKRFLARGTAAETRLLMGALAEFGIFAKRVAWLEGRFDELSKGEVAPLPLVNGDDLVAAGMKPGPVFKRILEAVYDAQLEGRVVTKEEGLGMAEKLKHKQ
jgi:poly(A) polymerase